MINYLLYLKNGMTTGIMARSPVRLIDYFLLIINKNDMTFNSYKSIINHRSSSIFLSKIPSYLLLKSSKKYFCQGP